MAPFLSVLRTEKKWRKNSSYDFCLTTGIIQAAHTHVICLAEALKPLIDVWRQCCIECGAIQCGNWCDVRHNCDFQIFRRLFYVILQCPRIVVVIVVAILCKRNHVKKSSSHQYSYGNRSNQNENTSSSMPAGMNLGFCDISQTKSTPADRAQLVSIYLETISSSLCQLLLDVFFDVKKQMINFRSDTFAQWHLCGLFSFFF